NRCGLSWGCSMGGRPAGTLITGLSLSAAWDQTARIGAASRVRQQTMRRIRAGSLGVKTAVGDRTRTAARYRTMRGRSLVLTLPAAGWGKSVECARRGAQTGL